MDSWITIVALIQIALSSLMFGILIRHYFVDQAKVKNFSEIEKVKIEKWRHGVFLFFSTVILITSVIGYHLQSQPLDLYVSISFTILSFINLTAYLIDIHQLKQLVKDQVNS